MRQAPYLYLLDGADGFGARADETLDCAPLGRSAGEARAPSAWGTFSERRSSTTELADAPPRTLGGIVRQASA